jgi:hypothetical protein
MGYGVAETTNDHTNIALFKNGPQLRPNVSRDGRIIDVSLEGVKSVNDMAIGRKILTTVAKLIFLAPL